VINGVEKGNSGSGTETFHLFPLLAPSRLYKRRNCCTSSLFLLEGSGQSCSTRESGRSDFCLLRLTDPLLDCSNLLPPRLALPVQCSGFLPYLLDQLLACSVLLCRKQPSGSAIDICERCRLERLVGWVVEFSIMIYLAPTAHKRELLRSFNPISFGTFTVDGALG
jgi:hypothetical protein